MKNWSSSMCRMVGLLLLHLCLLGLTPATADVYTVDPVHSYILFKVKHLGIGFTYGQFIGVTGSFSYGGAGNRPSSIKMQVPSKNIYTGDTNRDNHLRSPDFFNIEKHPTIDFKGQLKETSQADIYLITGDLTILGITRPVKSKVRQTGHGKDPQGKYRRGFETKFSVKRSEYGMNFMLGSVSDEVELTISIEGTKQ